MENPPVQRKFNISSFFKRLAIFFSVFGPATITAMADNDASGVATYSIAGSKLGYPILFLLGIVTILLAVTQEMGMRLTLVTRKGLGDLIREQYGVRISILIFTCLFVANMGTIIVDLSAVKTTSAMFNLPPIPSVVAIIVVIFFFVTRGNYRLTQNIMLVSSIFYLAYIISAIMAKPDWGLALSNLVYPNGVNFTPEYMRDYLLIGMGVLGTTITPWGQFFISSFAYDKKIESGNILYSQLETYLGAFLTDFFSFFMIVATAASLFASGITLQSGEQAALAIKPLAGDLAGELFAIGILNAGFMGIVIVSLSTAYAFTEFFGLSSGLNTSFRQSRTFYILFIVQLVIASLATLLPGVNLFDLAVAMQTINAMALPLVFYFLINLTSSKRLMGQYANNRFQKYFAIVLTVVIVVASFVTVYATFFKV